MKSCLPCHSRKKPRPGSCGFHHQPLCGSSNAWGSVEPFATMSNRSIARLPPGQDNVPWVGLLKARVISPSSLFGGSTPDEEPPSVCPPEKLYRPFVNNEPSSDVAPVATSHVARPVTS